MARNSGSLVSNALSSVRRLYTTVELPEKVAVSAENQDRLYRRLSSLRKTGVSVAKTLNEYMMEGKAIKKDELTRCIRQLRRYNNFDHALQVMDWMEKRKMNLSYPDCAIRLDLIAKTKGVAEAENYFSSLLPAAKNVQTYGALLGCYCKELMIDKALALFKKMDGLNYLSISLPFTNLMTLYMKLDKPEKVIALVSEMKQRNVALCFYCYNIWLQSYGCLNDIDGVERVLDEMKKGGEDKWNWSTYTNLATIYVKAGLVEKAESVLKMLEGKTGRPDRQAYHFLISLYARLSNQDAVNRVWNSMKSRFDTTTNISYIVMLNALANLKDVEGLIRCFKEWESSCSNYDIRVANVAIRCYLEHNMYEEAELVLQDAIKRTNQSLSRTREKFMVFFLKHHQLDLALEHVKATFAEGGEEAWRPDKIIVSAFFDYFEEAKDVDGAEKFCILLKHINCFDSHAYHLLLKTYVAAEKLAPVMRQRLDEDGIEMNSELQSLLEKVCP